MNSIPADKVSASTLSAESDVHPMQLVEWLEAARNGIVAAVHGALRSLLYDNRSYLRPALLRPLAEAEVTQFLNYARQGTALAVQEHAKLRAQEGLGPEVLLTVLRTISKVFQEGLDRSLFGEAVALMSDFQSAYLAPYIEAREDIILSEQEHIRSALQGSFNRYYTWLQTAAEVSKAVTSTLDLRQLIAEAVSLIRSHFDHHHVALYLIDRKYAVLRASSGRDDQQVARAGQKVRVGDSSLVGQCALDGLARTVSNTMFDRVNSDKTLLPETKSVMLLPLISRRRNIGVISIQSSHLSAFYDDDITRMQTIADQLANAVENARLYFELQIHSQKLAQAVEIRTAELVRTTERVEAILTNSPDAILMFDRDRRVELANPAAYEMFSFSDQEMIGVSIEDIVSTEANEALLKLISDCTLTGQPRSSNMVAQRADHSAFDAGVSMGAIFDDERVTGLVCVVRDITEQIQAEAQIKSSLHEKEVLLREIHHRVKNNMQVMSSLIALQSGYTDDDTVSQMFYESQSRIRSMALVHEQLYRSSDLAHIDFSNYIGELTANLLRSYDNIAGRIRLNVKCDPIYLDIDTAIPCGLIINELVSNALKHAFPDSRQGIIDIEFRHDSDHGLTLIVRDNGVGLPAELNVQKTDTLGLQLVASLTAQLSATIGLQRNKGTTFEIRFARPTQPATELHKIANSTGAVKLVS